MASLINIGITGVRAAQASLIATSHNISNVSTAGYSRQVTQQQANTPLYTGAGFLGQGVSVTTVQRQYSEFLQQQVLSAQSRASELDSYKTQIEQVDDLLADPDAGLSPALQGFFNGLSDVAANPTSSAARQSLISSAQSLTSRFQLLDGRLSEIRSGVDTQIQSSITNINAYSRQIADLNQRIILAQAGGTQQPANDLYDQRDKLIADLNKELQVSTITQSDGTLSVMVGNGQPLVVGNTSYQLAAVPDAYDQTRLTVGTVLANGNKVALPESMLTGGTLGGLLSFRSQTLDPAQNALGRVAIALGESFNAQHKLGQTLTGALGGNFFQPATGSALSSSNNSGSGSVTVGISDASQLTTSDYRLSYDGSNYLLTRMSDNTTWSGASMAALQAAVSPAQGFTLSMSGAPAAGDSFLIKPTRNGAHDIAVAITDTREVAAASPITTAATGTNTGSATIDAGSVTNLTNVPLGSAVTLTYNSGTNTFDATGGITLSGISYTAGQTIDLGGIEVTLRGSPANGDTFTIAANTGGNDDNRNALALGALQTANTMIGGTASYQGAYAVMVSDVGNKAREVEVTSSAAVALVDQATAAQQSVSGVNLDEEAANLIRFQQAYQASGKVLEIAGRLFDELLAIGR